MFLDEAAFGVTPPLRRAWTPPHTTHAVTATAHGGRCTVIGALEPQSGRLQHTVVTGAAHGEAIVAFLDRLAAEAPGHLRCVVLDNASIHTCQAVQAREPLWLAQGLWLRFLPPYSPELNPIEILWKHAKPFWRRFVRWEPARLNEEVDGLLQRYGTDFQISFK